MGTKKEYKVVEIIDTFTVLVNYGTIDNAKKGDEIQILKKGEDIIDPDTRQVIGTLDMPKDIVTVFITYEKFSICKKIIKNYSGILSPLSSLSSITGSTSMESVPLKVNTKQITNKQYETDEPIKVGDLAVIL